LPLQPALELLDQEESIILDQETEPYVPIDDVPAEFLLQQAIARKRDLKGSYKAKLSLEKLIVEHERKRLHLNILNKKLNKIKSDLDDLGSEIYEKSGTYYLYTPTSTPQASSN